MRSIDNDDARPLHPDETLVRWGGFNAHMASFSALRRGRGRPPRLVVGFGEVDDVLLEFLNDTCVVDDSRSLFGGHQFSQGLFSHSR